MDFKSVLITGGAGFVGANLALKLKKDLKELTIFCFDNLKRRGSELNLPRLKKAGIIFIHGDIRNIEDFNELPKIDLIIDASAEPSVLAGIDSTPDYLLNTNLIGTINCLNFAVKNNSKFLFLSTSRVYPIKRLSNLGYIEKESRFSLAKEQSEVGVTENGISEHFSLEGFRSLYGTSKYCSELIIQEYAEAYNLKTIINRCGVLSGAWQMGKTDQGVVVLWVAKHFWNQKLAYIGYGGTGKQVRDVLHLDDLYDLIKIQLSNFDTFTNETFNVGGGNFSSFSLQELTLICEKITNNKIEINRVIENRPADIPIYITDNSYVTSKTGWVPKKDINYILNDIYNWIKENEEELATILK